jgi:transcriptional regulator with XRE-family HTH domain
MNALRYIRKHVFQVTQAEFADLAGVGQASVSRWENGVAPSLDEMQAIRQAAAARNIAWNDRLFFEIPPDDDAPRRVAAGVQG